MWSNSVVDSTEVQYKVIIYSILLHQTIACTLGRGTVETKPVEEAFLIDDLSVGPAHFRCTSRIHVESSHCLSLDDNTDRISHKMIMMIETSMSAGFPEVLGSSVGT